MVASQADFNKKVYAFFSMKSVDMHETCLGTIEELGSGFLKFVS